MNATTKTTKKLSIYTVTVFGGYRSAWMVEARTAAEAERIVREQRCGGSQTVRVEVRKEG